MICSVCGCWFAPFPEQDFDYVKGEQHPLYGQPIEIVPKNKDAEKKRRAVFDSNVRKICDECLAEQMCDREINYNYKL